MKKKIIISSLFIGLTVSIIPINFIFNNKNYEELNIENEDYNQKEYIQNISNLESRDVYIDPLYDKNYTTIFSNNFTSPVFSPNKEIPGFLGAWDANNIGAFPTAIGWTTPDLYLSWSANLIDHPSLEGQVPSGFKPGLVTALHSDNKYSTNKRNQIFAIVANTSDLDSREYWILRYNTLDGSPIKDSNSKMPKMKNAPLPEMTAENGNGSAFSLTNDTINNRYIAFYPGKLVDFKNDIFGFKLNNDNQIEWLENKTHFNGHSNWTSLDVSVLLDYFDENIVIGLSPFNTKRSSADGASLALMVAINPPLISDSHNYHFKVINLQDNLSANENFKPKTIVGRTAGIFNNNNGTIAVPKSLLPLSAIQKNINPNLQLFNFKDDSGNDTYKVQMVVPVLKDNEWIYVYLSSIFNSSDNSYHVLWKNDSSLSQGSFFRSASFGSNPMPPNISYNENYPQEFLITYQANSTDDKRFSGSRFIFNTMPPNGPWDPTNSVVNSLSINPQNTTWGPKHILTRSSYIEDDFIWSLPNGYTEKYIINELGEKLVWSKISGGGIKHESFQKTASTLQWLKGQNNAKIPSEITSSELEKIGSSSTNFFKIPNLNYPSGVTASQPQIKIFGNTIKDDSKGILEGIFTLTQNFQILNKSYDFESRIPFRIIDLNIKSDSATSISHKNSILDNLPSELNPSNVSDYMNVIAAPEGAMIDNWTITNQNNAAGTATISVDINPHFNNDGIFTNSSKKISTNVSGFKKLSGTSVIKSSATIPSDKTVWDFSSTDAPNFIEVKDLIPNSQSNAVTYLIQDQKPLIGELTVVTIISPGSYYNPNNNGLPSIASDPPLEVPITFRGFKLIPDTGTIVIPGKGPYIDVLPSSINDTNIMDYITIENSVPGTVPIISNILPNEETSNSANWFVSFDIFFEKEYDTNGYIINGKTKNYKISGFEFVTEQNNLVPIIAGSIGGGIFLIILIILLIILLWNRKNKTSPPINSGPRSSLIVLPSPHVQENFEKPHQSPEIVLPKDNIEEQKIQPPRTILKEPRKVPFSELPSNPEIKRLAPSPTLERPNSSRTPKSPRPTPPSRR
ncbi:MAG: hypothetical protein ACRDCF_02385 [Mycoplasmoidaceae bacterium]